MFAHSLEQLPGADVRRILILRTAPAPQVQWAVDQLRIAYPWAAFTVLGRQLGHSLFDGMRKMEVTEQWLNPRNVRRFRRGMGAGFDLAVMCLNSDTCAGYEQVSRIMKQTPARLKLVAGYTREWYSWRHDLFREGNWFTRLAAAGLELLLLPLAFLIVAAMPAGRTYMPKGQGRSTPGYDR